jgi:hypothetical protein
MSLSRITHAPQEESANKELPLSLRKHHSIASSPLITRLQLPIHQRHPIDLIASPPSEPDNSPPLLRGPGNAIAVVRPGRHRAPRAGCNLHVENARVVVVRALADDRRGEALARVELEGVCSAAGGAVGEGLARGEGQGDSVEAGGPAEGDGGGLGGGDG